MRRPGSAGACVVALALAAGCGGGAGGTRVPVTAMTRNLYLGADIGQLAALSSPDAIPAAMGAIYAGVLATDFPARAKLLADEIVAAAPDLVGLEEVSLFRKQTPSDWRQGDPPNASEVLLDFLAVLQGELAARGAVYQVAVESMNGDAELPADDGNGGRFDLRLTDRDVILARDGVATESGTAVSYVNVLNLPVGGLSGPVLAFRRGYCTVAVTIGAARFTFATSHLEIGAVPEVQIGQADELLAGLAKVPGPLLLIGDFNSAATPQSTTAYPRLVAKLHDAFAEAHPGDPGLTCCQAPDLRNLTSQNDERVDLILYRGDFAVTSAALVGDDATRRTPSGLWPSDHFGVAATLGIRQP